MSTGASIRRRARAEPIEPAAPVMSTVFPARAASWSGQADVMTGRSRNLDQSMASAFAGIGPCKRSSLVGCGVKAMG